jgi:hypothetical protein
VKARLESLFMRRFLALQKLKDVLKRRNTFGDRIIIKDEVLVYEGDKLKFKTKGHIVDMGLILLINFLSASVNNGSYTVQYPSYLWTAKTTYMRLGIGGSITTHGTTGLSNVENTPPSSQSGANTNPDQGCYRVSWSATWNAGVLSAITVTEIGLWLCMLGAALTLQNFGWTPLQQAGSVQFFSRISQADGDFSQFVVNTSVPLTIEWRLTFSFA